MTDLNAELATRAAKELGTRAFASALDVRSFGACRAAASRTVRRAGSLDVWVNNAGVLVTGPAWEQDERTRALSTARSRRWSRCAHAGAVTSSTWCRWPASWRLAGVEGIEISCLCPDGIWTPMLYDKLEDPSAAASFAGVLLRPEEVAVEVEGLLDKPQPVVAIPRRRGMMVRLFDLAPSLTLRYAHLVLSRARRRQRRYARRAKAGKLTR